MNNKNVHVLVNNVSILSCGTIHTHIQVHVIVVSYVHVWDTSICIARRLHMYFREFVCMG